MRAKIRKRYVVPVLGGAATIDLQGEKWNVNGGDSICIDVEVVWSAPNWRDRLLTRLLGIKVELRETNSGVLLVSRD